MKTLWLLVKIIRDVFSGIILWLKELRIRDAEKVDAKDIAAEKAHLDGRLQDVQARIDKTAEALLRPIIDEDHYVTLKQRQFRLEREADELCNRLMALVAAPPSPADPVQQPGTVPAGSNDPGEPATQPPGTISSI